MDKTIGSIAKYLEDNSILIVPSSALSVNGKPIDYSKPLEHQLPTNQEHIDIDKETLFFYKVDESNLCDLGCIVIENENVLPQSYESVTKQLKLPGFSENVVIPLRRFLREVKGDFYNTKFDPIQEVLDRIEKHNYN